MNPKIKELREFLISKKVPTQQINIILDGIDKLPEQQLRRYIEHIKTAEYKKTNLFYDYDEKNIDKYLINADGSAYFTLPYPKSKEFSSRLTAATGVPKTGKIPFNGGWGENMQLTKDFWFNYESNRKKALGEEDAIVPEKSKPKGGGGGGFRPGQEQQQQAPKPVEIPNPFIKLPEHELRRMLIDAKDLEEAAALRDAIQAKAKQALDAELAPKEPEKKATDWIGNLSDAGRAIIGFAGAMKDIPEYKQSRPFDDHVRKTQRMSEMGFTQEEKSAFNNSISDAYAYDVKSIKNMAAGSAGAALANIGRAADRVYSAQADFATRDAAVNRQNIALFGQAAQSYEQINRQKFQDKLTQAMMNKEAGAALARDAVTNIINRSDYEKAYGPGSQYDKYSKLIQERTAQEVRSLAEARYNMAVTSAEDYYNAKAKAGSSEPYTGVVNSAQDTDSSTGKGGKVTADPKGDDFNKWLNEAHPGTKYDQTAIDKYMGEYIHQKRLNDPTKSKVETGEQLEGEAADRAIEEYRKSKESPSPSTFKDGGVTPGKNNHKENPLKVVNKRGQDTGLELTGGEGVFDKQAMGKIQAFASAKQFEKLGKFVVKEMATWPHK